MKKQKYKSCAEVPTKVLIKRLRELSGAVSAPQFKFDREFTMSIPPQYERDADLVLAEVADRLERRINK